MHSLLAHVFIWWAKSKNMLFAFYDI